MPLYCHIVDVAGAESRIWEPIQHESEKNVFVART